MAGVVGNLFRVKVDVAVGDGRPVLRVPGQAEAFLVEFAAMTARTMAVLVAIGALRMLRRACHPREVEGEARARTAR